MATIKEILSPEDIRNSDRLVFLSDGFYAIALTILVLDIKLPASFDAFHFLPSQLLKALEGLQSNILAYIISFLVIGLSWRAHNLIFHYVKRYDTNIFWLNLLLLLSVAFIPFPTSVLALGINTIDKNSNRREAGRSVKFQVFLPIGLQNLQDYVYASTLSN